MVILQVWVLTYKPSGKSHILVVSSSSQCYHIPVLALKTSLIYCTKSHKVPSCMIIDTREDDIFSLHDSILMKDSDDIANLHLIFVSDP